tara:strand:- start:899 stop:1312 length:414 start_codon:yes stop_codon:yes gene_type:complete
MLLILFGALSVIIGLGLLSLLSQFTTLLLNVSTVDNYFYPLLILITISSYLFVNLCFYNAIIKLKTNILDYKQTLIVQAPSLIITVILISKINFDQSVHTLWYVANDVVTYLSFGLSFIVVSFLKAQKKEKGNLQSL